MMTEVLAGEHTSSRTLVQDDGNGIQVEAVPGIAPMLISFGGISGGLISAPFEFGRVTEKVVAHRVFVRDLDQAWYHRGVREAEGSVDTLAAHLRSIQGELQPSRTVTMGNSCGGFAALLFGSLIDATEVHAFAPQTYIGPWRRLFTRDFRWKRQMLNLHLRVRPKLRYYDLLPILTKYRPHSHIYYSLSDTLDVRHAKRLASVPSVQLHPYETGGHNLVKQLRETGELKRIIRLAIDPSNL